MNKVINIGILLLLVIFISFRVNVACNELRSEKSSSTINLELPVTIKGILQCELCPDTQYTLTLEQDKYLENSITLEEIITQHQNEGIWELKSDTLYIYDENDLPVKRFLWGNDEIILLNQNNSKIGTLAVETN